MSHLSDWRRKTLKKSQQVLSAELGYEKWQTYAAQERGDNPLPVDIKDRLRKKYKYDGDWPDEMEAISVFEEPPSYETRVLPHHIAEAWAIVHEAAMAGGADIMLLDIPAVGEILSSAAEAVAAGRGEEARLRAVRKAETLFRALGKSV